MLLAVDKPSGMSSFDVIRALRKVLGPTPMWHSGTLDPLATGLLLVATGADTKKLTHLIAHEKSYIATIDLSQTSDTRDTEYRLEHKQYVISERDTKIWLIIHGQRIPAPSSEAMTQAINRIHGTIELVVPPFCAKKIGGIKMYDAARSGHPMYKLEQMSILHIEILSYDFPLIQIKCRVGSWCYIRSIAHHLWDMLTTGGIITQLRRTSIDQYHIENYILDREVIRDEKKVLFSEITFVQEIKKSD